MALINKVIPNLFNGISQQAPSIRHETQGQAQENCLSSIVSGLKRRPPLRFLKELGAGAAGGQILLHFIERSETERYVLELSPTGLTAYNVIDSSSYLITAALNTKYRDYAGYLGTADPVNDLVLLTIADTTIILNKNIKPAIKSTTLSGTLKGTKQRFSDLPATGNTTGDVWEIQGDNTNAFDNYYVYWTGTAWKEWGRPGENYQLDPATMPHKLVRNSDGTWTFDYITWNDRLVGDLASVPFPSLVGKRVNDIFFFRNRLGFLADENIIFSQSGDLFNFYPSSVTTVLDSDPIDVALNHTKVNTLNHAIPYHKSLLVFSNTAQFQVEAADVLTPRSVQLNQTTEFECSPKARPVASGPNVYFIAEGQSSSTVMEYFVDTFSVSNDADNITAHCPAYLPNNIIKIVPFGNLDLIFFLSSDERNTIYVYKYYWKGDEKVQSSWSKWTFDEHIHNMGIMDNKLYLATYRPTDISSTSSRSRLFYIDLQEGILSNDELTDVYLDDLAISGYTGTREQSALIYDVSIDKTKVVEITDVHPGLKNNIGIFKGKGFPDSEVGDPLEIIETPNTSWTPEPAAWFKPDSLVEGRLATWTNSGTGGATYNASQSDTAKRPLVVANVLNGYSGVFFESSRDDYLLLGGNPVLSYEAISAFAVVKVNDLGGYVFAAEPRARLTINESFEALNVGRWIYQNGGWIGSDTPSGAKQLSSGSSFIAGMRFGPTTKALVGFADDTLDVALEAPFYISNASLTGSYIGGGPALGASFDGYILELLVFDKELSDEEVTLVQGYLAHKYGLTGNLSSGHSYKASSPSYFTLQAWASGNLYANSDIDFRPISPGASLKAWYKPDSLVAGTLSAWNDSADSGPYNASQSDPDKQPSVVANQLNGYPTVVFDGTNDTMSIPLGLGTFTQNVLWVFSVARTVGSTTVDNSIIHADGGWTVGLNAVDNKIGAFVTTLQSGNIGSWNDTGAPTFDAESWVISAVTWNGNNLYSHTNGGNANAITGQSLNQPPQAATSIDIGSSAGAQAFFKGDIAEVIVIHGILSSSDRNKIEGYLAHKYGLVDKLPSNHPYKNVSPFTTPHRAFVGIPYVSKYEFSPQYPKDSQNNSVLAQSSIKLRRLRLVYNETGQFTVEVTPKDRSLYTYRFKAKDPLDSQGNVSPIGAGIFSLPVGGDGKDTKIVITEDSYRPFAIQSVELEAFVQMRSRRI